MQSLAERSYGGRTLNGGVSHILAKARVFPEISVQINIARPIRHDFPGPACFRRCTFTAKTAPTGRKRGEIAYSTTRPSERRRCKSSGGAAALGGASPLPLRRIAAAFAAHRSHHSSVGQPRWWGRPGRYASRASAAQHGEARPGAGGRCVRRGLPPPNARPARQPRPPAHARAVRRRLSGRGASPLWRGASPSWESRAAARLAFHREQRLAWHFEPCQQAMACHLPWAI